MTYDSNRMNKIRKGMGGGKSSRQAHSHHHTRPSKLVKGMTGNLPHHLHHVSTPGGEHTYQNQQHMHETDSWPPGGTGMDIHHNHKLMSGHPHGDIHYGRVSNITIPGHTDASGTEYTTTTHTHPPGRGGALFNRTTGRRRR